MNKRIKKKRRYIIESEKERDLLRSRARYYRDLSMTYFEEIRTLNGKLDEECDQVNKYKDELENECSLNQFYIQRNQSKQKTIIRLNNEVARLEIKSDDLYEYASRQEKKLGIAEHELAEVRSEYSELMGHNHRQADEILRLQNELEKANRSIVQKFADWWRG